MSGNRLGADPAGSSAHRADVQHLVLVRQFLCGGRQDGLQFSLEWPCHLFCSSREGLRGMEISCRGLGMPLFCVFGVELGPTAHTAFLP